MGFKSTRCTFSISAISEAWASLNSRITTGTLCKPASCAARQRRSPATISYWISPLSDGKGRTRIGCKIPRSRTDIVSSVIAALSNIVRGCFGFGLICVIAISLSPVVLAKLLPALFGTPDCPEGRSPNKASNPLPRPRAGFFFCKSGKADFGSLAFFVMMGVPISCSLLGSLLAAFALNNFTR